ncbi:hypothetical protein H6G74_13610 [Nostoc spongiaeforme FACHB-130]|uniref:Uncharacterized protein n=1 Tax=Nostoc spongiaeforme FACHB-130 TaxID=1357510 RepID=A0ABR8FW14_9NOSO|nr:hypothetical protein [Nostoc spongiaeforme]MBD2595359.1 hypothetical protein [Nostoc spongiaeforme FACHB-130]
MPGSKITLDPIKVNEVFTEGSNQVGNGKIETNLINPSLPTPTLTTIVDRTIQKIWQLELTEAQDETQISVSYSVNSDQGTENSLSKEGISEEIKVVSITPINPTLDPNSAKRILEGGATFRLDFSDIKTSGSYSGILKVTFTGI